MIQDKRKRDRLLHRLKINYTVLSEHDNEPRRSGFGHSVNISPSGVCLITTPSISGSKLLHLNIQLPVKPFSLLILGKPVWCAQVPDSDGNSHRVGIRFLGLFPQVGEIVRDIAKRLDTQPICLNSRVRVEGARIEPRKKNIVYPLVSTPAPSGYRYALEPAGIQALHK